MEIFNMLKILNFLSVLLIFANQYKCNESQKDPDRQTFNNTEVEKNLMGKKFDFFMPRYDFQRPYKFRKEGYSKLMKYASDHKRKVEVPKDVYIMTEELISEYEEIYKKEILHRIINKEVNLEEVAYDESHDIYAYPDVNEYKKQKPKFISNEDQKMKNYDTLGNFLKFSHKKIEVVDKPICIATMVILNIQNIRNENIVIRSIKSDLFQAAIFISKGKEMPHSYNQKNLYPKVLVPEENFSLQVIVLPDMIGRTVGNIYFELSDNKVIVFPLEIKAVENIYKISPIYVHNWPGSKLFISQINLYNPHPKTLIIKEVINSFSSINLIWPNGQPVSSNHTSLSSSMLEVPSKTSKNILQINFYKDVPGVEYGLLQLKTDRDTLIIPVVVGVEVQAIKFYPNYYNFGVIDINRPIKRMIPINLSNLGLHPIQIKSIYSSFEENLIEFVPNLNNFFCNFDLILTGLSLSSFTFDSNKGSNSNNPNTYTPNICIINRIDNMNNFGFLMIDPSNFKKEINGRNMNKKVRGSVLIQTNFTDNPFIELTYEYLLDRDTLSFEKEPELYYENNNQNKEINFEIKAKIKSPFYTTYRDMWKNTTSDLINFPHNLLYSNFEIEELNEKKNNKYDNKEIKQLDLKLKILNTNHFQNKKNYFFPVKINSNMITLLPVKLFDKSIELHYCDNISNYKECLSENYSAYKAVNFKSQNLNIDFGLLPTSEPGKKYFNLINDNGKDIKIEKIESDSPLISLAIESVEDVHTNKKIYNSNFEIGKTFSICNKKNPNKELPSLTIPAESYLNLSINLASETEQNFSGLITIHMSKQIKFKINLTAKFLKGNLNITPSTVRFEPAFPGLFQSKLVSSKSSYNIPINIHSIKSFDQRIIPVILTNSIISNNRTEIVKIIFDPSKVEIEENFMKGDGFANITSKHLTYKELYLWKEKQKLWEILGSQGRTEINTLVKIKTNIQTETVNVRGFLTKPSLVKKDEVEFGLVQLGESNSNYIEVFNPSDEPMSIQILLAPEEFSDIHNNTMFFNNKQRLFPLNNITMMDCSYFNISNFIDQTSQNFTQNFINNRSKKKGKKKEDENESNLHSILIEEELLQSDLNDKKIQKYDLLKKIFLYTNVNSKINFLESERIICNTNFFKKNEIIFNNNKELIGKIFSEEFTKEINIIKRMTDRSPPSNQRNSNKDNSQNIFDKIAQYLKVFFKTDTPQRKKRVEDLGNTKQEFFLPKSLSSQVFVIKPHQKTKIGPIIYSPNVHSNNSTATLFIKNNLTVLYPIKLKGFGGSGLLNFFLLDENKIENKSPTEEKIEKLIININSLDDIDNENNEIKKVIKIKNTGNLAVNVSNTTVKDSGCEGYGIRLSNCNAFSLKPNESMNFIVTIIPDFNFYYLEKEILFKTTHQAISIKVIISISTEILVEKNRLFNFDNFKNYGIFYMSGSFAIILVILYILKMHKIEMEESEKNKNQVLNFVSGKELIENNNLLKFENLYIKAYRPNNRSFYEDFFSKHLDAPSKSEVEHLLSEKKKKGKTDNLIRNKENIQEENNSEVDLNSRPSENERKEIKTETTNTTKERPTVKKTEKSKTTTTKKPVVKKQPIGITPKTTEKKEDEKKTLHNILNSNQPQNLLPGSIYQQNKNSKFESGTSQKSNENQTSERDSNLSGGEFYNNANQQNWVADNAYYQQMGFWPKNYQGGNVGNYQNFVPQNNTNVKGFNNANNNFDYNANFNKQGKPTNSNAFPFNANQQNPNNSKSSAIENKSQVSLNPNNPNFIPQFIQAPDSQYSGLDQDNSSFHKSENSQIDNLLNETNKSLIDLNKNKNELDKKVSFKETDNKKEEKQNTKTNKKENTYNNRDEIKPSVGTTNIKEQYMSFVPGLFTQEKNNKDEATGASNFLNMNFINPDEDRENKNNDSKNEGDSNPMDNFKMIDFTNYFTNKENENENDNDNQENSEGDEQNNESANENDFDFNKYRSDREKVIEDSGTEDRGNDIKFNFNSIFGQNSMKFMNNTGFNEYNTDNEEPVKQNFDGNKPYFDNKLLFSFDSVFNEGPSKQTSTGAGGLFNSGNLFSGNASKTGGLLSELRDDENVKETGKRNDDWNKINKLDDVAEIEDDEDDEEDPVWGDDNVTDINKEGFFDASGNYKLKQMDFNFNLDFSKK